MKYISVCLNNLKILSTSIIFKGIGGNTPVIWQTQNTKIPISSEIVGFLVTKSPDEFDDRFLINNICFYPKDNTYHIACRTTNIGTWDIKIKYLNSLSQDMRTNPVLEDYS